MRVRIAGTLDDNQKKAIPRAKMYHGPDKYEYFAGCVIWCGRALSSQSSIFGCAKAMRYGGRILAGTLSTPVPSIC